MALLAPTAGGRRLAIAAGLLLLGAGAALAVTALKGGASADPVAEAAPVPVPAPVTGHPEPLSLLEDADPTLAANKRLVFDMWRSIVNAGQVELADEMLQPGYVQHSPVLPTGREAFKAVFSAVPRREIPQLVSPPLVAMLAERDLVVMALAEELPEPSGEGRYTTTHFNLFRVEQGRLAEHWHSVQSPPGPDVQPPERGGPQPVTGALGAAQAALLHADDPALAAHKRLAFDAWLALVEAGRRDLARRYLADAYLEHDPTLADGLPRSDAGAPAEERGALPAAIDAPLVAVVADGDLVVLVRGSEHPHPSRAGATYTTTLFDMFRIADGRIVEHWSGLAKPGTVTNYGD